MNKPEGKNQQGTFGQGPEHGQMPPNGGAYQDAGQGAGAHPGGTPQHPWGAPQEQGVVPPYHHYYGYYGAPGPPWRGVPAGNGGPSPTEPPAAAYPGGTPPYSWGAPQGYGTVPPHHQYYGYYGAPGPPWSGVPAGNSGPPPTEPPAGAYPGGTPSYSWEVPQGYGVVPPYHHYYGYYGAPGPPWSGVPTGHGSPPPTTPPAGVGTQAGFGAALGDMADKSGLGMFKDLFNWEDSEFWKGALVGAAVVLLMTNENLRNSLIGGAAKTAEAVKSGFAGVGAPDEVSESETEGARDEEAPQDNP
jgi:hypothetical protein